MAGELIGSMPWTQLVTQGTYTIEQNTVEGERIEAVLRFSERFSGFETYATVLDNNLRSGVENGERMTPWPGNTMLVYVDLNEPVYRIKYLRGGAFMTVLTAALIATAILLIYLIIVDLRKHGLPSDVSDPIKYVTIALIIFGLSAFVNSIGNTVERVRRTETRTEYGRGVKPL